MLSFNLIGATIILPSYIGNKISLFEVGGRGVTEQFCTLDSSRAQGSGDNWVVWLMVAAILGPLCPKPVPGVGALVTPISYASG